MRRTYALAAAGAIGVGALVASPAVQLAAGDTDHCVSQVERDNWYPGLDRTQTWNRFDIYGDYLRETVDGEGYLAEYAPLCWTSDKRIVIRFDYTTGGGDWLDVRDLGN
jgi:hypothetical protein